MLQTKAPQITRYDYEGMPQGPPYYQVIEGDLIMSPSPETFHQSIAGRIYALILRFLEGKPMGEVFIAPAKELWLVDPVARLIHVYDLARDPDSPSITHNEKSVFTTPLLPGLRFRASSIFRSPLR